MSRSEIVFELESKPMRGKAKVIEIAIPELEEYVSKHDVRGKADFYTPEIDAAILRYAGKMPWRVLRDGVNKHFGVSLTMHSIKHRYYDHLREERFEK